MYKLNLVMRIYSGLLLFLLSLPLWSQDKMVEEHPQLFAEAAEEKKSVMIIFDHPNCGWCRVLDNYHALPEVKEILDSEFLIYKIDISVSESGKDLWEHYNFSGVPAWRMYTSKKELISDGRTENGDQIGYPLSPASMEAYIKAISKSSRHIRKKELDVLREKIVYCNEHF